MSQAWFVTDEHGNQKIYDYFEDALKAYLEAQENGKLS